MRVKVWRLVAGVVLVTTVGLNVMAYAHARAMTHFSPGGVRTPRPELLSPAQKLRVLMTGAILPRPVCRRTPADVGLTFERRTFDAPDGTPLEAWLIPGARDAVVVMFHGYADCKDSLLREARAIHEMGYGVLLVDFRGSGGSGGHDTTIGFRESQDVSAAFAYASALPPRPAVTLYGVSMGAAAVLKALADDRLQPASVIVECPFDSLLQTVRHRFETMHVPAFPAAHLLVFWGGVQQGFDGFHHNPADYATRVSRPVLLMSGAADDRVTPGETRAIFEGLRGPKRLRVWEGVGHASSLRTHPDEWKALVSDFLDHPA
jgi:hypothetical protein